MFARILFGTDFSKEMLEAERMVAELAARLGSAVVVLHAIEPVDPTGDQEPYQTFYTSLAASAREKLEAITRRFADRKVPCEVRLTVGPRWREIVDEAERSKADLIVLGSRPRSELLPGTTSHKVFWTSPVPVLFVRRGES